MKFTKRQIELLTEIRNLAANLNSAAEDLLYETEYESRDLDDLIGICEQSDSMVSEWLRETETGQAAVRLGGVMYEVSPAQWRLLDFLWNRKTVKVEDMLEALYGINYKKTDSALFSLCNRLNRELADQNCPASVHRRSGYILLDLPASE